MGLINIIIIITSKIVPVQSRTVCHLFASAPLCQFVRGAGAICEKASKWDFATCFNSTIKLIALTSPLFFYYTESSLLPSARKQNEFPSEYYYIIWQYSNRSGVGKLCRLKLHEGTFTQDAEKTRAKLKQTRALDYKTKRSLQSEETSLGCGGTMNRMNANICKI